MHSRRLYNLLEIAGLFGVFVGLIFVGVQLYFDRQVARVANTDTAASREVYWAELVNENADVWVKGLADERLSPTEEVRFDALASAREMSYFGAWSRSTTGLSGQPPERLVVEAAMEIYANPGFLRWWREDRAQLTAVRERIGMPNTSWGAAVTAEIDRLERESSSGR